MANVRTIHRLASALATAESAPWSLPCIVGRKVGFMPYDNGFNLWPESSATVVLGWAICRNVYGAFRVTRSNASAAYFIWEV